MYKSVNETKLTNKRITQATKQSPGKTIFDAAQTQRRNAVTKVKIEKIINAEPEEN